jgi:hypothetical protein
MTRSIDDLVAEYRSTAIAWDVMQNDSKKANPLLKRLQLIFKKLRIEPAERAAISRLMVDATVGVGVLVAASHSLGWESERAIAVLEGIKRGGPGLHRTTARYTLKSFREGTLHQDW